MAEIIRAEIIQKAAIDKRLAHTVYVSWTMTHGKGPLRSRNISTAITC